MNSLYTRLGMHTQGLSSLRFMHPIFKGAIEEYQRRSTKRTWPEAPVGAVKCEFVDACARRMLTAVARNEPVISRACILQVVPFYFFDRPTSALHILRRNNRIYGGAVTLARPSLALGRKNKRAKSTILSQLCPTPLQATPPMATPARYLQYVEQVSDFAFHLHTDKKPGCSFATSAGLLHIAEQAVRARKDPGRTPHEHCRGSTTAAHKLGVPQAMLNLHADWTPSSTSFECN